MRVRQLVGQQAGEIVEIPYAQATALLATGQVLHPWEASKMVGGPRFDPEPMPEHLSAEPVERGEQLAAQGFPDVQAQPGAPAEPAAKGKKGVKDPAADPAKPAPLAEDAPRGETSRGAKAAETVEAAEHAKGHPPFVKDERRGAPEPMTRGDDHPGRVTTGDVKGRR